MERKELKGDDAKADSVPNWVFDNAQGNIIILSSAPTAAIPLIKENQRGYYDEKIYEFISGVLVEYAISETA